MDDIPRTSGDEHGESCISTVQELTSYFSENRTRCGCIGSRHG